MAAKKEVNLFVFVGCLQSRDHLKIELVPKILETIIGA